MSNTEHPKPQDDDKTKTIHPPKGDDTKCDKEAEIKPTKRVSLSPNKPSLLKTPGITLPTVPAIKKPEKVFVKQIDKKQVEECYKSLRGLYERIQSTFPRNDAMFKALNLLDRCKAEFQNSLTQDVRR